jgi:hypothetical protein
VKRTKQKEGAGTGTLRNRAFGPAANEFGKELVPVGKELGIVSAKVSRMLISGLSLVPTA